MVAGVAERPIHTRLESAAAACVAVAVVVVTLNVATGWPQPLGIWLVVGAVVTFAVVVVLLHGRPARTASTLLARTLGIVAMLVTVCAAIVVAVVGLGGDTDGRSRSLVGWALLGGAVGLALGLPLRRRVEQAQLDRLEEHSRDSISVLQAFEKRMTRAVPMEELQLQLVETLHRTLGLLRAELWVGSNGVFELVSSVPAAARVRLAVEHDEAGVVARTHISGPAWLQVWLPGLLERRGGGPLRVAPVSHLGELLGLIVVERDAEGVEFTEADDAILSELARPLGLALHNVRLDSALQASLDELEARNAELQASRLRIVTAADESRRRIERDLHDGAQQHLVALAVKVGLVNKLLASDPDAAQKLLEELRGDVQATLEELRSLAHGIYPPLLRDRGLVEALRAAANRSPLPTSVTSHADARYEEEVEAAVYFCCLEALQNAGKYAGEHAKVTICVAECDGSLSFEVHDNGPGFDPTAHVDGHGFANMRDRLGAIGGELVVSSTPEAGTTVAGSVPGAGVATEVGS